jgi:hypothetical protein
MKKDKKLSTKHINGKQKDGATKTPQKTVGALRCSGRDSSSCSTSDGHQKNGGTGRTNVLIATPIINYNYVH